jgi:orotidine-5'-phosphate decarboxylase
MSKSKIIVALDFNDAQSALKFSALLTPESCRLKVGKELFTAAGPNIIEKLHQRGFEVFLDLKFHDIPNTVYGAICVAANLGVWMVNVHASGGIRMLEQARSAIDNSLHKPLLIAVTILTSLSSTEVADIGYQRPVAEQVLHLAKLSHSCGLDGVVCGAPEAASIKAATNAAFLAVTPGIRLASESQDDQQRVMTPRAAISHGADYLVIGRPITRADAPLQLLQQINAQID